MHTDKRASAYLIDYCMQFFSVNTLRQAADMRFVISVLIPVTCFICPLTDFGLSAVYQVMAVTRGPSGRDLLVIWKGEMSMRPGCPGMP